MKLPVVLLLWQRRPSAMFVTAALLLFLLVTNNNNNIMLVQGQETDLFPDKAYPMYSQYWTVQYNDTYKVVSNLATNTTYLLYQTGTEPPSSSLLQDGGIIIINATTVIEIPVTGRVIGVTQTPTLPFLELLGVQTQILAYLGNQAYIASPCIVELLTAGSSSTSTSNNNNSVGNNVGIIAFNGDSSNRTALEEAGIAPTSLLAFATEFDTVAANYVVLVSEYKETSNAATLEWLKFYSLFFNLEGMANTIFNQTIQRATCVETNAAQMTATADEPTTNNNNNNNNTSNKPLVLWGIFNSVCQGWSVATCPNYYCEFASACSATLIQRNISNSTNLYDCNSANFLTTDQFVTLGQAAQYWFYPSTDWNTIYANFSTSLDTMVSVQNKQVYDYQGSGENAWFEERYAEYDVVLQDFCSIVGTLNLNPLAGATSSNRRRFWFRNVFTEPVGSLGQCTNVSAPLLSRGSECVLLPATTTTTTTTTTGTDGTSAASTSLVGAALTWLMIPVLTIMMMTSGWWW